VYIPLSLDAEDATWGDAPSYHTPDREFVYPGRCVLVFPDHEWPHIPEDCPGSLEYGTQWYLEDTVLVCLGCGLDST
jgi:hypothetical protein